MYLINDYRILEKYKRDKNGEAYISESLRFNTGKKFIKIKNRHKEKFLIDDYIANFPQYISISHDNLLETYEFDVIKTIDLKAINAPLYLVSSEYCDWKRLSEVNNLNVKEISRIIIEILKVVDFLHFRGFPIKILNPDIIFISEKLEVKLLNISSIIDLQYNLNIYESYYEYISPEILLENAESGINSDYYSIGIIIKNFLISKLENDSHELQELNNIVEKCLITNYNDRKLSLKETIKTVCQLFNIQYNIDYKKERGTLNFNTSIVGLEKYLNMFYYVDKNITSNSLKEKAIIYSGKKGTGKSIVLKEWGRLAKLNLRDYIYFDFSGYDPLNNNLNEIIIKFLDFLDVIYDFSLTNNNFNISTDIGLQTYSIGKVNERHNIFSIIEKSIINKFRNNILYIVINDLDNIGKEVLEFIDYLLIRLKEYKVFFVLSSSESTTFIDFNNYVDYWQENELIVKYHLNNLDKVSSEKFVQKVLGMGYPPYEFADKIYRESKGNPRYMEILLRYLYDNGTMYMNDNGNWALKIDNYEELTFPKNVEERFKVLLNELTKTEITLLSFISCVDGIIYYDYLTSSEFKDVEINSIIESLRKNRIIYLVNNESTKYIEFVDEELKWALYGSLSEIKKTEYHREISKIILNKKISGQNYNFLELMYQLSSSFQFDLLKDLVYEKREEESNKYSDSFLKILELCYSLIKNKNYEKEIDIMLSLIEMHNVRGEYKESKRIIDKIFKSLYLSSKLTNKVKTIINIFLFEIYIRTDKINMATVILEEIESNLDILDAHNLIRYYYIKSVYYMGIGENDSAKAIIDIGIEKSLSGNITSYLGDFYNIKGICKFIEGNSKEAIENYEKSIEYFNSSDRPFEVVKPLNNIANEYGDNYGRVDIAIEYYLQCIEILREFSLNNKIGNFLNNLAESYITTRDYDKALDYLEEADKICKQTKDRSLYFYVIINTGTVMLHKNDIARAIDIYYKLKDMNNSQPILDKEILINYSEFLSLFYYRLGDIDLGLKFSEISIKRSQNSSIKFYSRSQARRFYLDIINNREINRAKAVELLNDFSVNANKYDYADYILNTAFFALYLNEYDFYNLLIEQYDKIDQINVKDKFKYDYTILNRIKNVELDDQFDNLTFVIENKDKFILPIINYYFLIKNFSIKSNKYLTLLKTLLYNLDFISDSTKDIVDEDFKRLIYSIYEVERNIELVKMILRTEYKIELNLFLDNKKGEGLNKLISDLPNDIYEKIFYPNELMRRFRTTDSVLTSFTNDSKVNIELMLKYISAITNANDVFVKLLAYNGYNEEYISIDNKKTYDSSNALLESIVLQGNDIIYNKNLDINKDSLYEQYIDNNLQAFIMIPLYNEPKDSFAIKEKRDTQITRNKEVIGFLCIQSFSNLNRIDYTRYYILKGLSKILYLNIQNQMLFNKSNKDTLTKAYTRERVLEIAEDLIQEYNDTNLEFALLMIDVDKFKNINDSYGHQFGDEVLCKIVDIVNKNIRNSDFISRYGGEEFLLLLQDINIENAYIIAEKIRKAIENHIFSKNNISITVSIGISHFPTNGYILEDLIFRADQALYFAKEIKERNSSVCWSEEFVEIKDFKKYNSKINYDNIFQDIYNTSDIIEISKLYKENLDLETKISIFLKKLIETTDSELGVFLYFKGRQIKQYAEFKKKLSSNLSYSVDEEIINRVRLNKKTECFIDWNKANLDKMSFERKVNSVLVTPILIKEEVIALVYLENPLKNKEFGEIDISYVELLSGVFSGNLLIH